MKHLLLDVLCDMFSRRVRVTKTKKKTRIKKITSWSRKTQSTLMWVCQSILYTSVRQKASGTIAAKKHTHLLVILKQCDIYCAWNGIVVENTVSECEIVTVCVIFHTFYLIFWVRNSSHTLHMHMYFPYFIF